jgi:hypothetical protein
MGRWAEGPKIVKNDVRMEYKTELLRRRSATGWDVWIKWPGNFWEEVHPDHLAEIESVYQKESRRHDGAEGEL